MNKTGSTQSTRRWPRWLKALLGIGVLILLIVGTVFLLGVAATARWERFAAGLRDRGQPLTFAEIEALRATIPEDRNGARVIERLSTRLEEIKKGARGGDCIQIVNTRQRTNCGTVYYESKRTKHFQPEWIEKFKNDVRRKNADIGVLVTETMPTDMPRMGLVDGIWVCTYQEFKGLSFVMREMIVRLDAATTTSKNKGDKMGMLYDFLTSNEFRLQMETIVTGFSTMQSDLEREKRSMQTSWKRREKQIRRVIESTADMYGSIQGIAGAALPSIESLALPEGEE